MTSVIELCSRFYHPEFNGLSLWQAVFTASAGLAAWRCAGLLRRLSRRALVGLGALLVLGAALRLGLSPRNMVETNYRGVERHAMLQGFHSAPISQVAENSHYYVGYGQTEYWKLFLGPSPAAGLDRVFLIDGLTAILTLLLVFAAAWLASGDEETGLWCAALAAFSPLGIRIAFGDSVYGLGGTLLLLSLIHFLLFFEDGSPASLASALGFSYCMVFTHVAFLPFLLTVPFFYPLRGRSWRSGFGLVSGTSLGLAGLFCLAALPAYVVGWAVFRGIAAEAHVWSPSRYFGTLGWFLTHEVNSFFNPAFNPRAVMALSLAGAVVLLVRNRPLFWAAAVSIAALTLPLPPAAVWLREGRNLFANTGAVKQEHVAFFYFLAAACALRSGIGFLGQRLDRSWLAAAACCLLALQPLAYRGFITHEFNCQRELSFLRRTLAERDLGKRIFTLCVGISRVNALQPGRYAVHSISRSASIKGNTEPPALHAPTLRFLDWLLWEQAAPVFYLSFDCFFRHPLDGYRGKGVGMREDCADFLGRYSLKPIVEETFASEPYNIEFDGTDFREIRLGFYEIRAKAPLRPKEVLSAIPEFDHLRRAFYLERAGRGVREGDKSRALEALDRVRGLSPSQGELAAAGDLYRELGEGNLALEVFDELAKMRPGDAGSAVSRAETLGRLGRKREALETLARVGTRGLDDSLLRRMSVLYRDLGEPGRALSASESGLGRGAEGVPLMVERAALLSELGRRDEALDTLGKALALVPSESELRRMLGLLRGLKDPDRSLAVVDRLLELHPGEAGLYRERARLLRELDRPEPAFAALRRALVLLTADEPGLRLERAEVLAELGHGSEAVEELEKAAGSRLSASDRMRMELVYRSVKEFDRALAALDALVRERPKDSGLFINRAEVLTHLGRRSEALASLSRADVLGPVKSDRRRMVSLYRSLGEPGSALKHLELSVEAGRWEGAQEVERGLLLVSLARKREAIASFERGLAGSLSPRDRRRVARSYQAMGECGRALKVWDSLVRVPKPEAKDFSDKAVCAFRQGDWRTAVADLEKAIALAPGGLEAHVSLGAVYANLGFHDKALKAYERGLAAGPGPAELLAQLEAGRRESLDKTLSRPPGKKP